MKPAARRPRPALSAAQVVALVRADVRYRNAKRKAEKAELERRALIAKAQPKVTLGEWITARGWRIRIRTQSSGERFSLAEYDKKYKRSAQMREFISEGADSPRLDVEPAAEPAE